MSGLTRTRNGTGRRSREASSFRRNAGQIFRSILDHGELNAQPDLRRGQTHARRIAHGVAHVRDQLLNGGRCDFFRRERARPSAAERAPRFERS